MPDKNTLRRARADKRAGKSASTQAGEFVREEIHHIREGKHGAKSAKQAIAIGLSKARRAGVDLAPPEPGKTSAKTRRAAVRDRAAGKKKPTKAKSPARSRAMREALKDEGHAAASHLALSRHAHAAARAHTRRDRSAAARKAARTRARNAER